MNLERYLLYVIALDGKFLLFRGYYDRKFNKWKFQSYRGKQKAFSEECLIFLKITRSSTKRDKKSRKNRSDWDNVNRSQRHGVHLHAYPLAGPSQPDMIPPEPTDPFPYNPDHRYTLLANY
jgi:hypothetical protein